MRILFTGGTGFIGRNAVPFLRRFHEVFAPKRDELDLTDSDAIRSFVMRHSIDAIVHAANPNPQRTPLDNPSDTSRTMMQMFFAVESCSDIVKKIIYFGSGAMYDKSRDIILASEDDAWRRIPKDDYGIAKNAMFRLTHGNVINLCVFGCYGPTDPETKFITHCVRCCLRNEPITIRQDCRFDYIHIEDLSHILNWALVENPRANCYNVTTGAPMFLSDIAAEVSSQMNGQPIVVLTPGLNHEYTGRNVRLTAEYHAPFISIREGVSRQIQSEKRCV